MFHKTQTVCFTNQKHFCLYFCYKKRFRKMFHVKQNPEKHVSQENVFVKHFCETFCKNLTLHQA